MLILVAQCSALLVHTALGYWWGRFLRPVLAYPLAVLTSYVWLAFTWTLPVTFIRYLAGPAMVMCCSPVEHIDPAAPGALLIFSATVGCGLLALAVWRGGHKVIKAGVAVSCLILGGSAGYLMAGQLGPVATYYLADEDLKCAGNAPQVCVGEVSLARNDLREQISFDFKKMQSIGLPPVQKALIYRGENLPALHEGTAYIAYPPTMTEEEAHRMVASIYAAPLEQCLEVLLTQDDLQDFNAFSASIDQLKTQLTGYLIGPVDVDFAQEQAIRELYITLSSCSLPPGV
ncbi:hypothetical protein [Rothia nasimurium]|uniref:hypothetical protein n=1 Tax=Rothia nasimurium TaxID=85336 RepID=UPI003BA1DF96